VGKVKTSEFGEGVDPHQWTGSICPINPRGDREQKPSSSSTGSAVATAAYSWLDCAIGTDTGGSIRHPAGVNGLFGSRPTQGAIDLSGVYSATDLLNTLGILTRDATTFSKVGTQLLPKSFQPLVPRCARKYKLLYPVRSLEEDQPNEHLWFPNPQSDPNCLTEAEKQLESFVQSLEHHLNCTRTPFNLASLWRALKPRGSSDSLDAATGHIYSAVVSYSAVHTGGLNTFITDYTAAHNNQPPAITPIVNQRITYGNSIPAHQITHHLTQKQAFTTWVENVLFGPPPEEQITLLIFPQSLGIPNYRADFPAHPTVAYDSFSVYAFGYLVGCPDYTVPVGEVPFTSRYTGQMGYLPVSASLLARRGNDEVLFDVLTLLEERGALRGAKAGERLFG
jgi:Asp-tRNA(Asn)/Glu-tRNA(Gln) amidotransferase A subunit family amidase